MGVCVCGQSAGGARKGGFLTQIEHSPDKLNALLRRLVPVGRGLGEGKEKIETNFFTEW